MADTIRYVTDVPYTASFTAELAPEWLDFVAILNGFAPPDRRNGFAWCELGCGAGIAPIVFAATHPDGRFHGIDAMPDHIALGSGIAESAAIDNLAFHALDFAAAAKLALPKFQYIVSHGVYAWIDEAAAASFRGFIARHLAPGGLVYVSYNAMPGWAADGPFQHLVHRLAATRPGNSLEKFAAAAGAIKTLREAGAAALIASPTAVGLEQSREKRPAAYFAHEYLAPAWRPLYVDDVRRAMRAIGLAPVGSATLRDNFDGFVLRQSARDALEAFEDPDQRELVRDYFKLERFRRDVFGRDLAPLDDEARRERLFACNFALMRPAAKVEYATGTEAGRLGFDNPVSRRLVEILAEGARSLNDCREDGIGPQDLQANALALCCAGMIAPVSPRSVPTDTVNAALLAGLDAKSETAFHVMPRGTALRFRGPLLRDLRAGRPAPEKARPWVAFLESLR